MNQTEIFQKNLARWALFCPEDAAALPTVDDGDVSIVDGLMYVGKGENVFECQNKENPLEEALECVRLTGTRDANVVFVFGVGAGFMYEALKEWLRISPKHQLVFLEEDLRVISALLKTEKGSEILFDQQVWLYRLDAEDRILEKLTSLFIVHSSQFLVLNRYVIKDPLPIQKTRSRLAFLFNIKQCGTEEYLRFGCGYLQNFYPNVFLLPNSRPADKMYQRFKNVPAIICGAGPSLHKNLATLEKLKDRALIFAGGTAMNAVNANGFVPHFGIGIDPNPDQLTRLITNTAFEAPYFYRNRLNHDGLSLIHGDHLYVNGSVGYGITKWLEEKLDIAGPDVSEGCNVINFSLSIAAEMGCSPIILVGVDLAYSNEESYAPGVLNHPIHMRRDHFKTKNTSEELIVRKDIHGLPVYTLWKWVMESYWFSGYFSNHPSIQLINATEGGIGFFGIPNIPLEDVALNFLREQYDFSGLVHAEIQRCSMPPSVDRKTIFMRMKELLNGLEVCENKITTILEQLDQCASCSVDSDDILDSAALESRLSLQEEMAYIHFLKAFDEAFMRVLDVDILRLEIDKALTTPELRNDKKIDLLKRRYQFLIDTTSINKKNLSDALDKEAARAEQWESEKQARDDSLPISNKHRIKDPFKEVEPPKTSEEAHVKYNEEGSKVCEYFTHEGNLHGLFIHYGDNGKVLAKTVFQNGQRSGDSVFYDASGNIIASLYYTNGKQDGLQRYFYPDGEVRSEINFRDGLLEGPVCLYNSFGSLCRELFFVGGKREGRERIWNSDGLLIVEANFKQNVPVGQARQWHENGNQAIEIDFDVSGAVISTKKWAVTGVPIHLDDAVHDDYFDRVTKQTGVLTDTIDNVVSQIGVAVPALAQAFQGKPGEEDINEINKSMGMLNEQMKLLKDFNQQLIQEAGLDPNQPKEPLWKSPSSRRELELHVEEKTNAMAQELTAMQKTLSEALKKVSERKDL